MKFKFVFIAIFLCSCLPSPSSGKCAKEMKEFYQCFRKVFDLNVGQYTRGIGYDDFQNHISDCFTSNGCKDFKLETRRDILKRSGQNDDMPDDMKKLKECKTKTRQKIRKEVEKCVQTPLGSDFQLGPETPIDYLDFPIDTVILDDIYVRQILRSLRNSSICPPKANLTGVVSCVGDLYDLFDDRKRFCKNPFDEIVTRSEGRSKACEFHCFDKIAKCSNETLLLTFQSLCDCSRNVTNTMRDVFENDLQTCMPVLLNQTTSIVVSDAFRQVAENTCFLVPEDPCELKKET